MRKCIILLLLMLSGLAVAKSLLEPLSYSKACVVYTFDEPYQYIQNKVGVNSYRGVDIEILSAILGPQRDIEFKPLHWSEGFQALKKGECDFVLGALYAKEREQYALYSTSYRYNQDAFYHAKNKTLVAQTIFSLFQHKEEGFRRLGVLKGAHYTSEFLNARIKHHPKEFIFANSEPELIQLLVRKKIDGYFAEKMQMELLLWRSGYHKKIIASGMALGIEPVHILMSKKKISSQFFDWFNKRLIDFKETSEYSSILRTYSVPLFIAMLTDGWQYRLLEILGTMFYAISGLILAKEARFSLTGAFILAMLPGIGGGLLRDVILSRDPVGVLRTPLFFMTVVLTTLAFYFFIRLRRYFKFLHVISDYFHDRMFVQEFSIVQATDAFGLAVFTIIGVMAAVEVQADPLWLWGPMIAVLSSTGGGIIRDFFMGKNLNRTFFYETAFAWSLGLTCYLMKYTHSMTAKSVNYAIGITFVGILITRITVLKLGCKTKDFWCDQSS